MKVDKKIKRLVVNLTQEDHKRFKILAAERNITLSKMTLKALLYFESKFQK